MMRHKFFFISFFIVSFIFSVQVWAVTIDRVEGKLDQNQSITILGSGFGSKPQAAPALWDAVDNISAYDSVGDGVIIPTGSGYPWSLNNSVRMEKTDGMRTSYSHRMYKTPNSKEGHLAELTIPNTGKLCVYYWWKTDTDPNTDGDNHSSKFIRASYSGNMTNRTFSWTQHQNYVYRSDHGHCVVNWNWYPGNVNQWNFHEFIIDGRARTYDLWVNGKLLRHASWTGCDPFDFDMLWTIGWDGGGASPISITSWMDDIYVDNTSARVVIGNAPSWNESTHREMQIPTQWASGQITVKVNRGSFAAGQTAYLYVIDAGGNASGGKEIVIGEGAPDDGPSTDVSNFTAQPGNEQITLSWTNPTYDGFAGTEIRYTTEDDPYPATHTDGTAAPDCDKPNTPGSQDSCTVTGLTNGMKYNFSAFTYDDAGNYSETAHVSSTPVSYFSAPTGLRVVQ